MVRTVVSVDKVIRMEDTTTKNQMKRSSNDENVIGFRPYWVSSPKPRAKIEVSEVNYQKK